MKQKINRFWFAVLLLATAIMGFWIYVMFQVSPMMMYDINPDVSKTMNNEQARHMSQAVVIVLRYALVPAIILVTMWILAFFIERKEHSRLMKENSQQ